MLPHGPGSAPAWWRNGWLSTEGEKERGSQRVKDGSVDAVRLLPPRARSRPGKRLRSKLGRQTSSFITAEVWTLEKYSLLLLGPVAVTLRDQPTLNVRVATPFETVSFCQVKSGSSVEEGATVSLPQEPVWLRL